MKVISFLIRNNNRFFLSWLRQLNLFSTTQEVKEVEFVLDMLYQNKVFLMPVEKQIKVYEKLSFSHHSIPKSIIHDSMSNICNKIGKDKYSKVISAIKKNRLVDQSGFLSDIIFSFMVFDKTQTSPVMQVIR